MVKKLDPPELGDNMQFIMLSPLVCSTKWKGEKYPQYLMLGDEEFERVLLENLLGKYEALHGKPFEDDNTELQLRGAGRVSVSARGEDIKAYNTEGRFA